MTARCIIRLVVGSIISALVFLMPANTAEAQSSPSKKRVRLSLASTSLVDSTIVLSAKVLTKEGRSYVPVPEVPVQFLCNEELIGESFSDELGVAIWDTKRAFETGDTSSLTFVASITDHDSIRDASRELVTAPSTIDIALFTEDDTVRYVKATLIAPDSAGTWSGVEDQAVRVFVKRLFGKLPLDDGYALTDEYGAVTVQFPDDIRGGPNGNVTIVAELLDHDEYGTVQAMSVADWGMPLVVNTETSRELWSTGANAPVYLSVIVVGLILIVWGFIMYVVVGLFKVKRVGKTVGVLQ